MKNLNLLIWLGQLGLSVAVPPVAFIFLAVYLRDHYGWGGWVVVAGVVIGVLCAVQGLRSSLKAMQYMSRDKKEEQPPVGFNDHE